MLEIENPINPITTPNKSPPIATGAVGEHELVDLQKENLMFVSAEE